MSELRRIMMMFPRPDGSTPSVTIDGYVAFLSDFSGMVSGSRIATDGSVETLSYWSISGYVEIPDDARYVYYDEDIDDRYTGLYDSSKTYIGHITKGNAVSLSAKYLRVSMLTDNISDGIIVILKEQREIPVPYDAEVEYLESSGTQYIDTNVTSDSITKIKLRAAKSTARGVNREGFIGTAGWGSSLIFYLSDSNFRWTNRSNCYDFKNAVDGTFYDIECNIGGELLVDGVTMSYVNDNNSSSGNLWLFAGAYHILSKVKIASCQMFNNTTLVHDFIPVRKNGVGYLYDKLSGALFGNSGSGSFTYGNDVTT